MRFGVLEIFLRQTKKAYLIFNHDIYIITLVYHSLFNDDLVDILSRLFTVLFVLKIIYIIFKTNNTVNNLDNISTRSSLNKLWYTNVMIYMSWLKMR